MYRDLREFVEQVERIGELRRVEGADPDLEIGAITEVAAGSKSCPMLLFDRIQGYPRATGSFRIFFTRQNGWPLLWGFRWN